MFVKICGIRTREEASAALDCGATALGFLVGLTHRAEDRIGEAEARGIVRRLPTGAEAVLVTHLTTPSGWRNSRRRSAPHRPSPRRYGARRLAAAAHAGPGGARLLKAVHVTGEDALRRALDYAADADALVLDTRTADRLGGTGQTHDWSVSARIVAAVSPAARLPRRGADAGERRGGHRAGAPGGGGRELRRGGRGRAQGHAEDARLRGTGQGCARMSGPAVRPCAA